MYELESRDDFDVSWTSKPTPYGWLDHSVEIPYYRIICPLCQYDIHLGLDRADYDRDAWCLNTRLNEIIMNRPDWKSRYKSEPRKRA